MPSIHPSIHSRSTCTCPANLQPASQPQLLFALHTFGHFLCFVCVQELVVGVITCPTSDATDTTDVAGSLAAMCNKRPLHTARTRLCDNIWRPNCPCIISSGPKANWLQKYSRVWVWKCVNKCVAFGISQAHTQSGADTIENGMLERTHAPGSRHCTHIQYNTYEGHTLVCYKLRINYMRQCDNNTCVCVCVGPQRVPMK